MKSRWPPSLCLPPTPFCFPCLTASRHAIPPRSIITVDVIHPPSYTIHEPGCIGALLEAAAEREGLLVPPRAAPRVSSITANNTLGTIDIPDSGGVIGPGGGGGNDEDLASEDDSTVDGDDEDHPTRIQLASGAWIPYDVLIGISIETGSGAGSGSGNRGWKRGGLRGAARDGGDHSPGGERRRYKRRVEEEQEEEAEDRDCGNGQGGTRGETLVGNNSSDATAVAVSRAADASWNDTGFSADYTFVFEPIVLLLPEEIQHDHHFHWINFTMDPSECFREANFLSRTIVGAVLGYDIVMANMFMFSMRSKGLLRNLKTEMDWLWSRDPEPALLSRLEQLFWRVMFKVQVVMRSVTSFVLMSTVTAMTVRTLLSSGVVIMFPLVMLMERLGLWGIELRMLSLSYPWLGVPIEQLRSNNKPVGSFILGHLMQMFVFYSVYNACLLAWSSWLYAKTMPTALQVWLYGMVMLWEYFALIFVRARSSIVFFSRSAALSFFAFHVYFYHFQMGYFHIAAGAVFCAMLAVKLYVLRAIELQAFMSGDVSHEQPRAYYVELPWPTWGASLPPMWSLFIPPNASAVGVYADAVPDRPASDPDGNNGNDTGNDGGNDGGDGGGGRGARATASGSVGVQNIPTARGERGRVRARGRGRARGVALGTPATTRRGNTEQERPLVGGMSGADGIEMSPR